MQLNVYTVYDEKTRVFFPPVTSIADGALTRDLTMQLRKGGPMAEFPSDYSLYQVGTWDDQEAALVALPTPRLVCRLDALISVPTIPGETS